MRVTREMIETTFLQVKDLAEGLVPNAETWEAEYSERYGGWAITEKGKGSIYVSGADKATTGRRFLGGDFMAANRIRGAYFYMMLRSMRDIFEKMQGTGRL